FFAGLSERSRYLRFHGFPALGPELVASFVEVDWPERGGLVGIAGEAGEERVVALAGCVQLRDPRAAEAAFAVADELQGFGVGTRLLGQLADRAAGEGIETFVAEVMPANRPMLGVFQDAGFSESRRLEEGVIEVRLDLEPTGAYRERVDLRDHVA